MTENPRIPDPAGESVAHDPHGEAQHNERLMSDQDVWEADDELADEWGKDSFPASDPPKGY